MFAYEADHWWFVNRQRLVMEWIKRLTSPGKPLKILDVGCGTGLMMEKLSSLGRVWGIDCSSEAVGYACKRGLAQVRQISCEKLNDPNGSYDVIICLDVLEHIKDEKAALCSLMRVLAPGGLLVVTVPAFRFLWSAYDVILGHQRRYGRSELIATLRGAGFDVLRASYFVTILFPAIALYRFFMHLRPRKDVSDLFVFPRPLNAAFKVLGTLERRFMARGNLLFGSSIICLCQKPLH